MIITNPHVFMRMYDIVEILYVHFMFCFFELVAVGGAQEVKNHTLAWYVFK